MLKLSDKLNNISTLRIVSGISSIVAAQDTIDFYLPLLNRSKSTWIREYLGDMCFEVLNMLDYKELRGHLIGSESFCVKLIRLISCLIREVLRSSSVEEFLVSGRLKSIWSIYNKLTVKNLRMENIFDVFAFRIVLDNIVDCYRVVKIIHKIWTPIISRLKDYILYPKRNGYQSLHTTVLGPFGIEIEIQVRTQVMHAEAESGIASHYNYKELYTSINEFNRCTTLRTDYSIWIGQLVQLHSNIKVIL